MVIPYKSLKEYYEVLPTNMSLKKKVAKCIMTSAKPLTQSEIKDAVEQKDWTNLKRVLDQLVEDGVVAKTRIGVYDYYVKVGEHKKGTRFVSGTTCYFIDLFEPDTEDGQQYVRVKKAIQSGIDKYDTVGKITITINDLQGLTTALQEFENKQHNNN